MNYRERLKAEKTENLKALYDGVSEELARRKVNVEIDMGKIIQDSTNDQLETVMMGVINEMKKRGLNHKN